MRRAGDRNGTGFVLTQFCTASRAEICCTGELFATVMAELRTIGTFIVCRRCTRSRTFDGCVLFGFRSMPYRFTYRLSCRRHSRLSDRLQRTLHRVFHCRLHFRFFHRLGLYFDSSAGRDLAGEGHRHNRSFHWFLYGPELHAPWRFFRFGFFFFRLRFRYPVTGEQPFYRRLFFVILGWLFYWVQFVFLGGFWCADGLFFRFRGLFCWRRPS